MLAQPLVGQEVEAADDLAKRRQTDRQWPLSGVLGRAVGVGQPLIRTSMKASLRSSRR